jgi:hypothetical protein
MKYKPSSGIDGDLFIGIYCDNCVNDDPANDLYCEILVEATFYGIENKNYPDALVYENGKPKCMKFKLREE